MLFGALPVLLCIQYEMNSGCFIFSYCIHRLHKLACRLLDENLKLFCHANNVRILFKWNIFTILRHLTESYR